MALTDNLQAYYKLDESSGNASDSSGNGNTLTNVNTATFSAGKINNGAALARASTQYFTAADSASLDLSGDCTFSFWVKIGNAPTSGQQYALFFKDANGANNTRAYGLNYENSGGTKRFTMYLFPTGYSYPGYWAGAFNYDLGTATWVHVVIKVVIANGNSTKVELFINGTSQGNFTLFDGTGATSIQNVADSLYVGYSNGGFQGAYDGMLDEVGIWSRALSSGEVTSLYNGGAGLQYPFSAPSNTANFFAMMM